MLICDKQEGIGVMKTPNDIWEDLGSLSENELFHVMTKLFAFYENKLSNEAGNPEALQFFRNLENSITQTSECNSNRR